MISKHSAQYQTGCTFSFRTIFNNITAITKTSGNIYTLIITVSMSFNLIFRKPFS
jgi:hypothetical protein